MNRFGKVFCCSALLGIAVALQVSVLAEVGMATEPRKVVVFGDSITAGNMLPADQRSHVWVHLVEEQSAGKLQLVNEGKGGRPTDSVAEFKGMLARQPRADLLVIALGGNDARNIKAECVPLAVAHLRTMIDLARKAYGPCPILLIGPTNIRKDALGPTKPIADQRDGKLKELNTAFALLAKQAGCDFVSLYGVVPETSLTLDGVHPDVAGNELIAKTILPKLLPAAR